MHNADVVEAKIEITGLEVALNSPNPARLRALIDSRVEAARQSLYDLLLYAAGIPAKEAE